MLRAPEVTARVRLTSLVRGRLDIRAELNRSKFDWFAGSTRGMEADR